MTSTLSRPDAREALNPDRVPIGIDATAAWLELRWTQIENPHVLIVGGSQVGKTTLQILIAAIAASRGNIVIILDPKLRFGRAFRHPKTRQPLPNVLVYGDADPDFASREWQGALELIIATQQDRYSEDQAANSDILGDRKRFPNVIVIVDELGTMLDFSDEEWPERKPEDHKGKTPIRKMLHTLVRAGAEAHCIGVFANQTAAEQELPAGTRTRTLCGQRVFLGPINEGPQWRMLAGEGVPAPEIPNGQKGAGAVIYADGKPIPFQAALLDWKNNPEAIYDLASRGVEVLRENGHINGRDRLVLAGHEVPLPGEMAYHVAGPWLDLLQGPEYLSALAGMDEDDEEGRKKKPKIKKRKARSRTPRDAVVEDSLGVGAEDCDGSDMPTEGDVTDESPAAPMVVGNAAAAEFCGLSLPNFRKIRGMHPIEGEIPNAEGNKPGWQEPDLKMWAMRYADNRGRRESGMS
ncbi:MAG TPA: type IV secretory system conjugative DNA transfer family protein, partial [Streptomyces sp.]